jgi:hypothetical protein
MNKLELLNTWHSVTLRYSNGQRCTIEPMYGTNAYFIALYYKGKRLPFYGRSIAHACEALKYVNSLGYE